ncbi:hypothetical protein ACFQ3Z_08705 [Streptomyces nogalater]
MNRSTLFRAAVAAAGVSLLAACGGNASADGEEKKPSSAGSTPSSAEAFTVTHVGGPTAVLEIAGQRILIDPTFDAPKKYKSGMSKTKGPAFGPEKLGKIDAVLLSTTSTTTTSTARAVSCSRTCRSCSPRLAPTSVSAITSLP